MAESIIAPSLSLRDKFDLLNSAKEIIPLGETKTLSGKIYTRDAALAELNRMPRNKNETCMQSYSNVHRSSWTWAALFIDSLTYANSTIKWGIKKDGQKYILTSEEDIIYSGMTDVQYTFPAISPTFFSHGKYTYSLPFVWYSGTSVISDFSSANSSITVSENTITINAHPFVFGMISDGNMYYTKLSFAILGCIAIF